MSTLRRGVLERAIVASSRGQAQGQQITVVGAGVIGLTTAVVLQRDGHRVQVIAAARGERTTSAVAAALWHPFLANPPERVNAWSSRSLDELTRIANEHPEAGVDLLTAREAADDTRLPWWAPSVPDLALEPGPHPLGAPYSLRFTAPRIEPSLHLPWLEAQLDCPVRAEHVRSLAEVEGDCIVNCTGLGARALTGDGELIGVYGQVAIVEPGEIPPDVALGDERDESALVYVIPRRREIVIGGCFIPSPDDRPLTPDPELADAMLQRVRAAGLKPGRLLGSRAGLRPYRSTVRVEREGRVIHNYGHGGSGYTLAWGCAHEVSAMLRDGNGSTHGHV
ncbi:FAD-dependent oxidoreductase [Sorangium sp. So ce145]|uniref:D-amino-acid oxidase n=1 Tax=Sorangium cellulosum (strain So ce56) TaxID=448385 RepID=A9FX96_SORC5|nr:D-amino-acid oxidase [Sorangium cellulosum So ce56]